MLLTLELRILLPLQLLLAELLLALELLRPVDRRQIVTRRRGAEVLWPLKTRPVEIHHSRRAHDRRHDARTEYSPAISKTASKDTCRNDGGDRHIR